MRITVAISSAFVLLASTTAAQETPLGKYTGSYDGSAQGSRVSLTLEIKSVENGIVVGTGERTYRTQSGNRAQGCAGEFPISGSLKGDQLNIRATEKFGPTKECVFSLRGTVSGNKIQGKTGPYDVELSR